MSFLNLTFEQAVAKADALKELGHTRIYLRQDGPWELVSKVEAGGSYRLSVPASARMIAKHPCGLTFEWSVDFEGHDANGSGRHQFNRDYLREVMRKLPLHARASFAELLQHEVLPEVAKRTAEIRAALNQQQDSEDCLRGLISFAEASW